MSVPSASFRFDDPDFFVAGAVGEPGQRIFYIQCGHAEEIFALRCEKQHVIALAQHLEELLADLPAVVADPLSQELRLPVETSWILGGLAFGFDADSERIVIIAEEMPDEENPGELASGRIAITAGQGMSFLAASEGLLSGGRPLCRICGQPMDPAGHICPRSNGHAAE